MYVYPVPFIVSETLPLTTVGTGEDEPDASSKEAAGAAFFDIISDCGEGDCLSPQPNSIRVVRDMEKISMVFIF